MNDDRISADVEITEVDLDVEPVVLSDGTVLDEPAAAEYGRDVADRAAHRRAGRPSLSGNADVSPRVSARVSAHTYELLRRRADAEHRPLSAVIREALDHYV